MLADKSLLPLLPVRDLARARAFYEDALGLRCVSEEPEALMFAGPGGALRLNLIREDFSPHPFSVMSWRVPDIAAAIEGLRERGVEFVRYPCFEQDELGVWTAPGGAAKVAWFLDPDKNGLSLVEVRAPAD